MSIRHLGGLLLVFLGAMIAGSASGATAIHSWDRGLALLDSGRPDAAAVHLYSLLERHPRRLDLLEACLRVEERRSHGDSVVARTAARLVAGLSPAHLFRRFLTAEALHRSGEFTAAADSFGLLAGICLDAGDTLSALAADRKAARSSYDAADSALTREAVLRLRESLRHAPGQHRLQAETRYLLAGLHFRSDALDQAEELFRSVLAAGQVHGFATLRCDALNALGGIMAKRRRQAESIRNYEDAVAAARGLGDRRRLCQALGNLGYMETHRRRPEKAREYLIEADQLARRWGYQRTLGTIQAGLGAVAEITGDRHEAVARFREAVTLSQVGGNTLSELGARQRLGYNLTLMGEYAEARSQFETCLQVLERSGSRFILNWVLGDLALANHKLGYLDEAAEYYRRAHEVNLTMDDRTSAAWCLNSLGLIKAMRGDYRGALLAHYQAQKEYEALDDREGIGDSRASIGEVYLLLGNYEEALQNCQAALDLARSLNDVELLRRVSHAMATAYSAIGQHGRAEENYLRVLDIARSWSETVVEIWTLADLADLYLEQGRKQDARDLLETARVLMRDEDYPHLRSLTCLLLGRAAESPDQAADWAEQALHLAEAAGLPDREWIALSDLGQYRGLQGDVEAAADLQRQAIERVESLRRRAGSDELRRHMLRPAILPYERLIELSLTGAGDAQGAFATLERSRSQILAGRLHAALAHAGRRGNRQSYTRENDLAATLTFLQSRLQQGDLGPAVRDSLRDRIADLENEFTLMKLGWSETEEVDAAVLYPTPPEANRLQEILAEDEHVLAYHLGPVRSYLFSVNRQEIQAYPLPGRPQLEAGIQRFLHLQKYATTSKNPLPDEVFDTARQELYSLLIAPADGDFEAGATLVIVPDGLLHRLPFAYLHDGQGYLLEKNGHFIVPSLNILGILRKRGGPENRSPENVPDGVLAIGCTGRTASGGGTDDRLHLFTDQPLAGLPEAENEARHLAEVFEDVLVLTGDSADERTIRSGVLTGMQIIHFATHGYADEIDSRRSYIVLNRGSESEDGAAGQNDGLLQWDEIVGLDMNASLVTLAACRSAGGVLTTGEGVTGLTQAFLHGGTQCVLAALTDVPDQDTRWLMDHFYRSLQQGMPAIVALREAQLAALEENRRSGRRVLASGFVLIGDGTVTYSRGGKGLAGAVVVGTVGLGVCALAVVIYLRRGIRKKGA